MMWKISSNGKGLDVLPLCWRKTKLQGARSRKKSRRSTMNYWRSSVLVFKTTKKMSRLLRKNISDEERWRNFWYESEWSTFYLSNEEDEELKELKQFAEDDQGDMSAGECDSSSWIFKLFCANRLLLWCSYSSWIAAETASGWLCVVSVWKQGRWVWLLLSVKLFWYGLWKCTDQPFVVSLLRAYAFLCRK